MKLPRLTLCMAGVFVMSFHLPAMAGSGSIIGDEDDLRIGKAVTGDFNADGTLDVVVCSGYTDRTTAVVETSVGAVYIFTSGVGHDTPLSAADGVIYGKAEWDYFGLSCSNAGDFNGDGVEDLVVGAQFNGDNGNVAGAVYVIPGSANILDIANVEDDNVLKILGAASFNHLGSAVAGIGDTDGDGYDDILIRGEGSRSIRLEQTYVVYGSSSGATIDLASTPYVSRRRRYTEYYMGELEYSEAIAAYTIGKIGDVNGDGYADFVVNGRYTIYVVLGGSRQSTRVSLEQRAAAMIYDAANTVYVTAGVGDVNGDGYDDVLLGNPWSDEGGDLAGTAHLWYGCAAPADMNLADTQKFLGDSDGDLAGWAVAGIGDVDSDGLDDFMIGAPEGFDNGENGSAFLVFGSDAYDDSSMTLEASTYMQEFAGPSGVNMGGFVGPAGDLDGNGVIYFIIGAPYNDEGGTDAGKIYIKTQGYIAR